MAPKYQLIRLSEDNFPLFHRLFCEVMDPQTTYQFLYDKYDTRYLGGDLRYLGYLALNEAGEAVSYSGAIPFRFQVGCKEHIGAHSCDHMTRSDARKQGLFVQLNDLADALCESLGIPFVFGFPNQNNQPILEKYAGWEIIDRMQVCRIPAAHIPWAAAAHKIPGLKAVHMAFAERRLRQKSSTMLISRAHWSGHLRNEYFYRYKCYSQHYSLKLKHGLAWVKAKTALYIGDLQLAEGSQLSDLIDELRGFARSMGLRELVWIGSSGLPETKALASEYPVIAGNAVGIKPLIKEQLPDLSTLCFTYGDYDTF